MQIDFSDFKSSDLKDALNRCISIYVERFPEPLREAARFYFLCTFFGGDGPACCTIPGGYYPPWFRPIPGVLLPPPPKKDYVAHFSPPNPSPFLVDGFTQRYYQLDLFDDLFGEL